MRTSLAPRWAWSVAGLVMAGAVANWLTWIGTPRGTAVEDVGELAVSAAAALCALWRAVGSAERERRSWAWLAAGCGSWAAGQALWSYDEVLRGVEAPFPSLADVGFLLFPVGACVAVLLHPARGGLLRRGRRLLDALMVTTALALVYWQTVLSAVLEAGSADRFELSVSLAYPLSDLAVLVLAVLTMAGAGNDRISLRLIAAGLAGIAVADSGFAYLTAARSYEGGAVDLGWFAGFLLLGLAALAPGDGVADLGRTSRTGGVLPYLPVALALTTTLGLAVAGRPPHAGQLGLATAMIGLLLARQYVVLRENRLLTERLAVREAELRHQAFHDSLTGLANRALFTDRLGHAVALHARDRRPLALLFLDLDDFKVVNDERGHAAGDELLVRVAERLLGAARHGDTVARLGGDEFAVLLEDGADPVELGHRLSESLRAPFLLHGSRTVARASIGLIALGSADAAVTADELLTRADEAMYAAKRAGKDRLRVYAPAVSGPAGALEEQRMTEALRAALTAGELQVAYQPVVDLADGRVVGLEALARWDRDGAQVPPDVFIPLAERAGLIAELTDQVLLAACTAGTGWLDRADGPVNVGVNVPPSQVVAEDFVDRVRAALRASGLPPQQLLLEITESGRFEHPEVGRRVLTELRSLGVRTVLDDFGTGWSSLAQLGSLPIDWVKVDRSFIDRLDSDDQQVTFLRAVLRLADDLGLGVVVEGVERPEQLARLRQLGCRYAQGYLLSRPVGRDAVAALLGVGAPLPPPPPVPAQRAPVRLGGGPER